MLITKITALRLSLAPALQGLCVFYVCVCECDYMYKCCVGSFTVQTETGIKASNI